MMKPKPTYKRGDIILVLFPHSNLSTAKARPAMIVQADNLDTGLPQVIVAMITSKMFRADHPSRVTIFYSEIDRKVGRISMDRVDQALRRTLGLL